MDNLKAIKEKYDILTDKKYIGFKNQKNLNCGHNYLDVDKALKNLIKFAKISDNSSLDYFIFFGTLLGIYRDNNLIKHDTDVDIFIDRENKNKFIDLLPLFLEKGFEIIRITHNDNIFSLAKDNDYFDIYFFKKVKKIFRHYYVLDEFKFRSKFLNKSKKISIKDYDLKIPFATEKVLKSMYGLHWRKPIENRSADNNRMLTFLRDIFYILPSPIKKWYKKMQNSKKK